MNSVYSGKFFDRTPHLRAAGAPLVLFDKLSDCLKVYPLDDAIETVLTEAGLHKVPLQNPEPKLRTGRHPGFYTDVQKVLCPPTETRFQTLMRDLRETTWQSYWYENLGRSREPVAALPPRIGEDFTFGIKTANAITMKDLINPDITPYEHVFNDAEYHRMYKNTHNDYFPGERKNREYGSPFNGKAIFGKPNQPRPGAACAFKMPNPEPIVPANNILADYVDRTHSRLGRPLEPNNNITCVQPGHRFGIKAKREFYSLPELLQPNAINCNFRKDFYTWLKSLNEIRAAYKKKNVNFKDLLGYCRYADADNKYWISIDEFAKILLERHLSFPHHEILPFAACFGIYRDDNMIHYEAMLNLFNVQIDLPDLGRIVENCDRSNDFITSYQVERCGLYKDNSKMPAAGVPNMREDLIYTPVRTDALKGDAENLGNETEVVTLVNPSILTNYGLSHIDLLCPRKPEFLRTLFERLGYQFPDDTFEKLWQIGQKWDRKELVSVETFREIMRQACPITVKDEPEDECLTRHIQEKKQQISSS